MARAVTLPPSRLSFLQPAPPQLFGRDAREVGFDIKNRRPVQHIDAPNLQLDAVAPAQLNRRQANRIRAPRRSSCKNTMRTVVGGRGPEQLEPVRPIEFPDNNEVRESLNVGK